MPADYLGHFLNSTNLQNTVRSAEDLARSVERKGCGFDAFAFTGLSGALVGPALSIATNKYMIAVRKGEATHSSITVETVVDPADSFRYAIVDDLIDKGDTVRRIFKEIKKSHPLGRCAAIFLYADPYREKTFSIDETTSLPVYSMPGNDCPF